LILGLLGLITPGLPTTPFILLTGFLYAKSSPKLYRLLEQNKLTGMYLRGINEGFGLKTRIFMLSLMWLMILITAFLVFRNNQVMKIVMIVLGIIGTISQLLFLKKKKVVTETADVNNNENS